MQAEFKQSKRTTSICNVVCLVCWIMTQGASNRLVIGGCLPSFFSFAWSNFWIHGCLLFYMINQIMLSTKPTAANGAGAETWNVSPVVGVVHCTWRLRSMFGTCLVKTYTNKFHQQSTHCFSCFLMWDSMPRKPFQAALAISMHVWTCRQYTRRKWRIQIEMVCLAFQARFLMQKMNYLVVFFVQCIQKMLKLTFNHLGAIFLTSM